MSGRRNSGGGGGGRQVVARVVSVVSDAPSFGGVRRGGDGGRNNNNKRGRDYEGSLPPTQRRAENDRSRDPRDAGRDAGRDARDYSRDTSSRDTGRDSSPRRRYDDDDRYDDRRDDSRQRSGRDLSPRRYNYNDDRRRDSNNNNNNSRRYDDRDRDNMRGGGGGGDRDRDNRRPLPVQRNNNNLHHHQSSAPPRPQQQQPPRPAPAAPTPRQQQQQQQQHIPSSPDYPPPTEAEIWQEETFASTTVRLHLPTWTKSALPGDDIWTNDPRTNCMRRRSCLVSSTCTGGLATCSCPKFPGLHSLTPTLLHSILPKASSASLLRNAAKKTEEEKDVPEEEEASEQASESSDHSDKDDNDDQEAEADDASDGEEEELVLLASRSSSASSPKTTPAATTPPPRRVLGETTGQLVFKNGVVRVSADNTALFAATTADDSSVGDQTCAFPFAYEPFRPEEDEPRLQQLLTLLFDRFWGLDAPTFLAYLASAYTGTARGRLVISRPGPAPVQPESLPDDPERRRATLKHFASVSTDYKSHQNTGPQFLERVLRAVHGDKEVQHIARLNESSSSCGGGSEEELQPELQYSHIVACDVRRFTTQLYSKMWAQRHGHQRIVWSRPAESEIVFSETVRPVMGPGSKQEKNVAAFRNHQKLARFDAHHTMALLHGETWNHHRRKSTTANESAACSDPPAYGAFIMWPLPVLPSFDRFTMGGSKAGVASWRCPLAREMRVVNHTSWSPEDNKANQWRSQLQEVTDVSTPALQAQLRRCWVELMVRFSATTSDANDIWATTRLSKFSINAYGVPDVLQELTESEKATRAAANGVAAAIDSDNDCKLRGLKPDSAPGGQWKWFIAAPAKKNL